jgi:hypothetical protein
MAIFSKETLVNEIVHKVVNLKVPHGNKREYQIVLGLVNLYFFGWGTALAALLQQNKAHGVIGLLQFFFPGLGWVWSILWGLKMVLGR